MKYYIRIVNGEPFEHPIQEDNFSQAFPHINVDNLPSDFAKFVRVPRPNPDDGNYIVSATSSYGWVGDEVRDVWEVVQRPIRELETTDVGNE